MKRIALISTLLTAMLAVGPAQAAKSLDEVLSAQPDSTKERYGARHPRQTLEFFGIRPGMTVVEALPGGGWYSKILIDYLGEDGRLVGADYAPDMFPLFGFFSEEAIEAKQTWVETWTAEASEWVEDGATVGAFQFGNLPESMHGSADAVVMIRALHNLARFEPQGGFLTQAFEDVHAVLKPGGIVGVVQHEARPDTSDEFASGSRGYIKRSYVIDQMREAGLEFVGSLGINQNANDYPGPEEGVWRLPPRLFGTEEGSPERAAMEAIGESNRMTLLFRKPG